MVANLNLTEMLKDAERTNDVLVDEVDFSELEFHPGDNKDAFYYFKSPNHPLIKHFVLQRATRVDTLCTVKLIKKGQSFSPRLRFWKRDMSNKALGEIADESTEARLVKASVDLDGCQNQLWKLLTFLMSFGEIEVEEETSLEGMKLVAVDDAEILKQLGGRDREQVVDLFRLALDEGLTEKEAQCLVDRRKGLDEFQRLLEEDGYFEKRKIELGKIRDEDVWQWLFEENPWIFGYGLRLIPCDPLTDGKLEQIAVGSNVFTGAGKRPDGILKARAAVQSLLFVEIKLPASELLRKSPYRPPDIYGPSDELVGAIAQVEKTAHKAVSKLPDLHKLRDRQGNVTGDELSTVRPRRAVVIGHLRQISSNDEINIERLMDLEIYRSSHPGTEIVTFDELYERACFIVDG